MDTEIGVRTHKVDPGEENTAPAGTQTHDLWIISPVLYRWAILLHVWLKTSWNHEGILTGVDGLTKSAGQAIGTATVVFHKVLKAQEVRAIVDEVNKPTTVMLKLW